MDDAPKRRRRIARPHAGTVIMAVAVVLGVTVLAPTVQQFISQRQRVADLEQHIATVESEISQLETEQARWSDPTYIQAQARGRLLFVKPGETSYLVTDSGTGAPVLPPPEASVDMHETEGHWLDDFTQSFVASGLANAPGATGAEPGATPPAPSSPSDQAPGDTAPPPATPGATP